MPLAWTWLALPGLAVGLALLALAAVVLRTNPTRAENRGLAFLLAAFGLLDLVRFGLRLLVTDPALARWGIVAGGVLTPVVGIGYILFLRTVESPISRPLRREAVLWPLVAAHVVLALAVLVRPDLFYGSLVPLPGTASWDYRPGPASAVLVGYRIVALLVSVVIAFSAYRRARTRLLRRQMRLYLAAFVLNDVIIIGVNAAAVAAGGSTVPETVVGATLLTVGTPAANLILALLLTYGILTTQLFGIDLQVKRGLEGSTVASLFAAVFFLTSEVLQALLPLESELVGVLAAAAIALVLRPIRRAAEDVADRIMPGVEDTEEYRAERKQAVYRASVEELDAGGGITEKERRALDRLREELELDASEAERIEAEVVEEEDDKP